MATYSKETALYDTGAIADDIGSAGNTADYYLTTVSGTTGISVHSQNDTSNFANINSNGLTVYKSSVDVATFGDTARIGKDAQAKVVIQPSGVDMYGYANDTQAQICHMGYASGNAESGTAYAPYFTFGTRASGSSIGNYSVAEGSNTTASKFASHAEGQQSEASGGNSHAEGYSTKATGLQSHAEGYITTASGQEAHSEGTQTIASGESSHAEGAGSKASGIASHAGGFNTSAKGTAQTAIGKYNIEDTTSLFIVGNGTANARSNAFKIDSTGDIYPQNIKMADFVTEQGTSGIWAYRKWNSGIAECWGSVYAQKDCTSAWGNMYDSGTATSQSFPSGLFTSAPTLTLTAVGHSTATLQLETSGAVTAERTCNYYYIMPYSATGIQATVNFHAIGRWK